MFDRASQVIVFLLCCLFMFPAFVGVAFLSGVWPQALAFAAVGALAGSYGVVRWFSSILALKSSITPSEMRRRLSWWRLIWLSGFIALAVPLRYGLGELLAIREPENPASILVPATLTVIGMLYIFPALARKGQS